MRVTGSEVIFCSHLCPPLHSSNSCRDLSQPERDDTQFLLGHCFTDTYTISGMFKILWLLSEHRTFMQKKNLIVATQLSQFIEITFQTL